MRSSEMWRKKTFRIASNIQTNQNVLLLIIDKEITCDKQFSKEKQAIDAEKKAIYTEKQAIDAEEEEEQQQQQQQ